MFITNSRNKLDLSMFLLALYLLWDNFLISEMTSIHVNNATTTKHPVYLSLCILLAC